MAALPLELRHGASVHIIGSRCPSLLDCWTLAVQRTDHDIGPCLVVIQEWMQRHCKCRDRFADRSALGTRQSKPCGGVGVNSHISVLVMILPLGG